ncbi:hypothetical protein CDG81_09710 [Actinopolyspora erythraea]|uniref:YprB ribonuclease H-like domain-containing protein n=1 Tax=Actinopolyspora erythraea TaxID=414996 RepID=A0A223RRP5_9ACTN|nr:hypothetical protein CDG81_09710 [Actinopolyspora erythraea]
MRDQNIGLSQIDQHGEMASFAARWIGSRKKDVVFRSSFHDGKEEMLESLWNLHNEADALLSWNGAGFDTKHANTEFLLAGMSPPSPSKEIDLLKTARSRFNFLSNKLDYVAQQLGLSGKIVHEGFGLWLKIMEDDEKAWNKFKRYNIQDVHLLIDLYDLLLPWIDGHPNVNLYDGDGCPKCGSWNLQSRGYRTTGLGMYRRYHCQDCGAWSTSGKALNQADIREA